MHGLTLPHTLQIGESGWLQSYWSQTGAEMGQYSLSLRWQDETAISGLSYDTSLMSEYLSTSESDTTMSRFDQEITLPASLPRGNYTVWLRLTNPAGQPLSDQNGHLDVWLGEMQVTPGTMLDRRLGNRAPFTLQESGIGPLTLFGFRLPATALRPGHLLPLQLIWQARRAPTQDYQLLTRLMNGQERCWQKQSPPTRASYPTSQWVKGALAEGVIPLKFRGWPQVMMPTWSLFC
ncbi:MAG: hypothetical protein IPL78_14230 [Chloroflexi bacterium]|nr:hypothetical protein [Chloroflexota bacterium]